MNSPRPWLFLQIVSFLRISNCFVFYVADPVLQAHAYKNNRSQGLAVCFVCCVRDQTALNGRK